MGKPTGIAKRFQGDGVLDGYESHLKIYLKIFYFAVGHLYEVILIESVNSAMTYESF